MNSQKATLRRHYRAARQALSPAQQAQAASRLAARISRHPWYRSAKHVALYWPSDGEISPLSLITPTALNTKNFYLPRILSNEVMTFHLYRPEDTLEAHPFGMHEPPKLAPSRELKSMDIILMPLVAFDLSGNRLGMGGGFYDRALKGCTTHPKRMGLAHALQKAPSLPKEPWDMGLHAIVTDDNVVTFMR